MKAILVLVIIGMGYMSYNQKLDKDTLNCARLAAKQAAFKIVQCK